MLWQLVGLLSTGKIAVTTNRKSNAVTIREIASSSKRVGSGNTSVRVRPGTYVVTVTDTKLSTQQVITIKARETKKVTIDLTAAEPLGAEPASSREARSLVVGTAGASFIDASSGNTYMIGQDGNEKLIDSVRSFKSISWADPSYGVGEDKDNNLLLINSGGISPLPLPQDFRVSTKGASFAVATDRTITISDGSAVYSARSGEHYVRVYAPKASLYASVLGANNGNVLLKQVPRTVDNNNHGDTADAGEYVLLDKSGSRYTRENIAYEAALSPDGQKIAISGTAGTSILDNQLRKIIDIPSPNVISLVWGNNRTLYYTINSQLWQYDTNTGRASVLADVSDKGPINTITPSQDGEYIYFLDQLNSNNLFNLYRVSLRARQPASLMIKLGVFLPNVVDACSIGYENFTQLSVVVHGSIDLQNDCLNKAQNYLQLYNVIDPTLNVSFSPSA